MHKKLRLNQIGMKKLFVFYEKKTCYRQNNVVGIKKITVGLI